MKFQTTFLIVNGHEIADIAILWMDSQPVFGDLTRKYRDAIGIGHELYDVWMCLMKMGDK